MKEPPTFRVIFTVGGVILALALWLFAPDEPAPAVAEEFPPLPQHPVLVPEVPGTVKFAGQLPEVRMSFASQTPTGNGVRAVAGNGEFLGTAVLVAVPDAAHKIAYLRGTDPRAVQYLQETRAAHEQLVVDAGPKNVDMSNVTAKNSLFSHGRRVPVAVEPK